MKIFALNFCLDLRVSALEGPFQFERVSWDRLEGAMEKASVRNGQQWYIAGEGSKEFARRVFQAQQDTRWRELDFVARIDFPTDSDLSFFQAAFRNFFKEKVAAGGMVQNEKGEFLLIYNRACWTLPKGHTEKGESLLETALREVKEETGLRELEAGPAIGPTYHTFWQKKKKRWIFKTTHWFHMKASANQPLTPQADEQIEAVAWHSKIDWLRVAPDSYPLNRYLFTRVFSQSLIS